MPDIEMLPVGKLFVDHSYQRPESPARVRGIMDSFDPNLLQVLEVSRRESGINAVIDGQTRMQAAKLLHGPEYLLSCRVLEGLTIPQEAELYVKFQRQRKSLTPIELYHASLVAGDELAVQVFDILSRRGLKVGAGGRPGQIAAVQALNEITKRDPEATGRCIDVLRAAWGDGPESFTRLNIRGMDTFLKSFPEAKDERIVKVLSSTPPEFIERKVKLAMGSIGGGGGNHSLPYREVFKELYNKGLRTGKLGQSVVRLEDIPKGQRIE